MKDNFKLLNNVEIDLNKYTDLNINNKEKLKQNLRNKIKENKKPSKVLISVASAAFISVGIIGAGIINPSLATSIPSVQKIFIDLNTKLNLGYDSIQEMQEIKLSSTINNITINIEEAICDSNNLYLTYEIKSKDKPLMNKLNNIEYEVVTEIETESGLGLAQPGELISESEESNNRSGYYKDDYTFVGFKKYSIISDEDIPNEFNIKMNITEIHNINSDDKYCVEGPWKFNFNVEKSIDSKRINLNQSEGEYKVNYIDLTPFAVKINLEFPESFVAENKFELKRIMIEDDKEQNIFRTHYTKDNIERNLINTETTTIKDGKITTNITLKLDDYLKYEPTKYIIIKFVDYKNIIENGKVITHEEIKETKDIEFKINLDI